MMFGKHTDPCFNKAVQFSGTPTSGRPSAPMMGEHTAKVLSELGYDRDAIDELTSLKAPNPKSAAMTTQSLMTMMGQPQPAKAFAMVEKLQVGDTFAHREMPTITGVTAFEDCGAMHGVTVLDLSSTVAVRTFVSYLLQQSQTRR